MASRRLGVGDRVRRVGDVSQAELLITGLVKHSERDGTRRDGGYHVQELESPHLLDTFHGDDLEISSGGIQTVQLALDIEI